ncbi:ATP-grasp domain-containing protein [Bacteroidota bacterium]
MNNQQNIMLTGIGINANERLYEILFGLSKKVKKIFVCGSDIKIYENIENVIVIKSPRNDEPNYLDFLLFVAKKHMITDIIPFIDSEVFFLSKYYNELVTAGIKPWVAENKIVINCIDKWNCSQVAREYSPRSILVSNPNEFFNAIESLGFPDLDVVCRPSSGPNGSGKGFRIISSQSNEWYSIFYDAIPTKRISALTYSKFLSEAFVANKLPPILITEYLPGQEYSCYICANNGLLIDYVIHKKNEYESGTTNTGQADVIESNEIEQVCKVLTDRFDLHLLNNIQLKRDVLGNLKLIEINPRVAGTILLAEISGHNLFARAYSIVRAFPFLTRQTHKKKSIIRRQVSFFSEQSYESILVECTSKNDIYNMNYKYLLTHKFIDNYDIYIFDLDNTLFDEWSYLSQCTISFLNKIDIHSDETKKIIINQLHQYYLNNGNNLLFDNVLLKFGYKKESVNLFLHELRTSTRIEIFLFNKVEELLLELKKNKKDVYIVTDGNEQQQKNKYDLLKLSRFIQPSNFICSSKFGGKPNIECIKSDIFEIDTKTICVFGDSIVDLEFAINLNADFIKFEWSMNKTLI